MPPITTIASSSPEKATVVDSAAAKRWSNTEQRAGQPGDGGREHEGPELVAVGVVALERGALLVLADRHQHVPERRAHDAQQPYSHREPDQRDHARSRPCRCRGRSAPAAALEAAQAAFAAGEARPAERDGERERAQGEREQREVDAAPAQDQEADDERQRRR